MGDLELIRSEIEHTDFPRSADGYDREAVDGHLRRVAELLARPVEGDASWQVSVAMADEVRRIGESAAARVGEIVAVAERTATEIVERAEERAGATVEAAEGSAETIRRQALEDAARRGEEAEREAQAERERAQAQADELQEAIATASTLLERLGSAGSLASEFHAISERMVDEGAEAEEDEAAEGVPEAEAGADDQDRGAPEEETRPPSDEPDVTAEAGSPSSSGEPAAPPVPPEGGSEPAGEEDPSDAEEEDSEPRPVAVWFSRLGGDREAAPDGEASQNGASDVGEPVEAEEVRDADEATTSPTPEADEPAGDDRPDAFAAVEMDPSETPADGDDEPSTRVEDEAVAVGQGDELTSVEAPGKPNRQDYRRHKMRMTAFNMLVRGSGREEVAEYLRESFELTDEDDELVEATLEEAAARTRGWKAVPNPIPPSRRRRFRGR